MKIPSFRSNTIDKYRDDLATALGRKAGKTTLSDETFKKLAYITNDRLGSGLGAVFTGPFDGAPVLKSHSCQLKLESLRSTLISHRIQFLPDSCARKRLDAVVDRLSKVLPPVDLARPSNAPQSEPRIDYGVHFTADTKVRDGGREVQLLAKGKDKHKTVHPTSEQELSWFVKEYASCKADMVEARLAGQKYAPPSFSTTDMRQFWTAALDIDVITDTLAATAEGGDLLSRVGVALDYPELYRGERMGKVLPDKIPNTPPQPAMPGPRELLDLIRESGWRAIR